MQHPSGSRSLWTMDNFPASLRLKSSIIQRICRYLHSQQDRFNACLISRRWSPAAIDVLWESPIFPRPRTFSEFEAAVTLSREANRNLLTEPLALRVRRLNLVFEDDCYPTVFIPV